MLALAASAVGRWLHGRGFAVMRASASLAAPFFGPPGPVIADILKRGNMHVDETTVRRIARLARIKITDDEAKGLEKELSGILDWVEQLKQVDTDAVEPMTRVVAQDLKKRKDEVTDGGKAAEIVANAPETEDQFFVVPKVVE